MQFARLAGKWRVQRVPCLLAVRPVSLLDAWWRRTY